LVLSLGGSLIQIRRKKTNLNAQVQSANLVGKRLTIRIITAEYLNVQKIFRYKYEIMSPKSALKGHLGFLNTTLNMNAGHTYYISFNKSPNNLLSFKIIREFFLQSDKQNQIANAFR